MSMGTIRRPAAVARFQLGYVVLLLVFVALFPTFCSAASNSAGGGVSFEPAFPEELGGPHVAADRSGAVPTRDGLTLRLTTDLGPVRIVTLEPSAPPVVRYSVHIETDARAPLAQNLLERYSFCRPRRRRPR